MDTITTDGVVLARTFVGEKDAIIKILTTEAGLVSASAKGIKNMKSKLAAGCGVFTFSETSPLNGMRIHECLLATLFVMKSVAPSPSMYELVRATWFETNPIFWIVELRSRRSHPERV